MIEINIDFTTKVISTTTTNDLTLGVGGGGGGNSFECSDLDGCATIQELVADKHTHANKVLLDTYDQTNEDISDAITDRHTHANKAILDTITEDYRRLDYNNNFLLMGS